MRIWEEGGVDSDWSVTGCEEDKEETGLKRKAVVDLEEGKREMERGGW